jgi:hypothetical protein
MEFNLGYSNDGLICNYRVNAKINITVPANYTLVAKNEKEIRISSAKMLLNCYR